MLPNLENAVFVGGHNVAVPWLLAQLTKQRTTTDESKVSALKLLEDAPLAVASRWRAQHPRPVSLNVEESLFKELRCYEICNLRFEI